MSIINARVEALISEGVSTKSLLKAHLQVEAFSPREIKVALANVELGTTRETFKTDYYDWLVEDARTEQEAKDYIEYNGSENVVKHMGAHMAVWKLVQDVRAS